LFYFLQALGEKLRWNCHETPRFEAPWCGVYNRWKGICHAPTAYSRDSRWTLCTWRYYFNFIITVCIELTMYCLHLQLLRKKFWHRAWNKHNLSQCLGWCRIKPKISVGKLQYIPSEAQPISGCSWNINCHYFIFTISDCESKPCIESKP